VYCHPSGGGAHRAADPTTGEHRFLRAVAAEGFTVVASDLGGPSCSWGTELAIDRIEAVRSYASRELRTRSLPSWIIGSSMGAADMLAYARRTRSGVAGMVAIAPVSDLEALRALGADDLRSNIDAAWGVEWPAPLPPHANPASYLSELVGMPLLAFYASDDPLVPAPTARRLADVIGGEAVDLGAVGHATAIDHVPVARVASFLRARTSAQSDDSP
jgi:pimeloyl-ACP methyl ester carboxylesterase